MHPFTSAFAALLLSLAIPAQATEPIPDELFIRHAKTLIPDFMATQSEFYGVPLDVDPDSITVPEVRASDVLHPSTVLSYSAYFLLIPIRPANDCRRLDAYVPGRAARATFFMRSVGQRFTLVRTCQPDDQRPPRVRLDGPREVTPFLSADEVREAVRPLLSAFVAREAAGAGIDWSTFQAKAPWFNLGSNMADENGYVDFGPTRDCRRVTVDLPGIDRRATAHVDLTYDAEEALPQVPREYQTVVSDRRRLRQVRFALVEGCAAWRRRRPSVLTLSPR